jgi:hypothetical protein
MVLSGIQARPELDPRFKTFGDDGFGVKFSTQCSDICQLVTWHFISDSHLVFWFARDRILESGYAAPVAGHPKLGEAAESCQSYA